MSNSPKVSIVIPSYNVAPYLGETLDSVLAQTLTDYEAIIVNDGSTDETLQVAESYRERFGGRLVIITQANRGLAGARNTGIRAARGEYIAPLDSDDVWLPDCLELQLAEFAKDPTLDLVFPNAIFWGSPNFNGRDFQSIFPPNPPITFEKVLAQESHVFGLALFKRQTVERFGGYDESLRASEDFDLWLRMLRTGCRFGYATKPLVKYRYRVNSLSNTGVSLMRNRNQVFEKVLNDPVSTSEQRAIAERKLAESNALLHWWLYRENLEKHEFRAAANYLALANAHYRKPKLTLVQMGLRVAPALTAKFVLRG